MWARPPYFSTKMRPEGPEKDFLETAPPPPLSQGLADRAPHLSEGLDRPLSSHISKKCPILQVDGRQTRSMHVLHRL